MTADWWEWLPTLLSGLLLSIKLAAGSLILGLPIGAGLAMATFSSKRAVRWLVIVVVEVGRGTPALVVIYFVYFGLTQIEITLTDTLAIIVALGLNCAAYASEIFRGGISGIPSGQWDAAKAVGLSRQTTWRTVILPQMRRNVLPPIIGLSILVFQTTALALAIGARELLGEAYTIGSLSFHYMSVIVLAGVLYAAISIPASQLASHLERRLDISVRRST